MDSFPTELLENILFFLSNNDIANVRLVNKHFNDIVDSCAKRRMIHHTKIYHCHMCKKVSISPLPIICTYSETREKSTKLDLCSLNCRQLFIGIVPFHSFSIIFQLREGVRVRHDQEC